MSVSVHEFPLVQQDIRDHNTFLMCRSTHFLQTCQAKSGQKLQHNNRYHLSQQCDSMHRLNTFELACTTNKSHEIKHAVHSFMRQFHTGTELTNLELLSSA